MSKTRNLQLQYYYFRIYRALEGSSKERREILDMLCENIADYLEENPQAKMADIQRYFGEPERIAVSFQPMEEFVVTNRSTRQKIWKTILWTLLGLLVLFVLFFLALYLAQKLAVPTYIK